MIIRSAVMNNAGLWLVLMGLVIVGTEGQDIVIEAENPLKLIGYSSSMITCRNTAGGEQDNLKWYGANKNEVQSYYSNALIYSTSFETNSLSLVFTNISENDAGEYTCNGTVNGTPQSATVMVMVNMPLIVTDEMAPPIQKVQEGKNGFIKCTGPGGFIVSWIRNGNQILQDTNGTDDTPRYAQVQNGLEITNVNASLDEGTFICNVFKLGSSQFKRININVRVTVPPKITTPPSAGQAVVGEQYRFECLATGKPPPEYLWFKDGSTNVLAGDRYEINKQSGILIIKNVIKDDEGVYKCDARNEADSVVESASLSVIIPPKILEHMNKSGEEGNDAVLICKAYGDPIPTIKWFKGDKVIQDATATQDINEKTVVSSLTITSLTKENGGQYTCEAATQGAPSDKKNVYLSVKYKPAFDPDMASTAWTWKNAPGNLTCLVRGEPRPTVEWYSIPNENGDRSKIEEESFYSISTKYIDANTVQSILRVVYDFTTPLGDYLCKATNDLGSTNRTIRLSKANPPSQPSVTEVMITPTTADFIVRFSSVSNAPPPKRLKVTVTPFQTERIQYFTVGVVNGRPKEVTVNLKDLTPSTSYTFEFTGESDAGEGQPKRESRNTPAPREPYKVVIRNSLKDGEYPTKYLLEWETPKNGGADIDRIEICHRRVQVLADQSPNNEYQFKETITEFVCQNALPNQSTYELTNLNPNTYYEVRIRANNVHGLSESSLYIFKTKGDQPIQTTVSSIKNSRVEPQSSGEGEDGISIGVIIAILIIAFIVLFIVVDVTCYYKKRLGVIMCFKQRFCSGSSAGAGGAKDAEKGGDDKNKKPDKQNEKEENTKPLLKTEEEEKNGKEELKEMEPEEKEKDAEKSPTIENAEEAKPAPESPKQETPKETKPEEKSPTSEAKPEAPAAEKKEAK
ncbi:neural cell adhesion molecule 2 isoform X3 [Magallana gigas]|uniref:neural cell adhesion molecule 2 isoform X3 n=1 Tax=Magallana gigas TaxID=29159 RepID=UPI00334055E7